MIKIPTRIPLPDGTQELLDQFYQYYVTVLHRKPNTAIRYLQYLTWFFRNVQKHPRDVNGADINRYIGELRLAGNAQNTQRLSQIAVRMFYDWYCSEVDPDHPNPTAKIVQIREERKIPNVMTPSELMRMVYVQDMSKFVGRRNAAMLCLLADTGIRVSELLELKVGNVRLHDNHFVLLVPRIKTHERQIPFGRIQETDFVSEYWTAYWEEIRFVKMWRENDWLFQADGPKHKGTRLTFQAVYSMIKRSAKKAGVGSFISPHSFRHFFATYSVINGIDIVQLKELLGHATVETTMRYVHISNTITGKVLEKTATAGMKAPEEMRGYVKILKETLKRIGG